MASELRRALVWRRVMQRMAGMLAGRLQGMKIQGTIRAWRRAGGKSRGRRKGKRVAAFVGRAKAMTIMLCANMWLCGGMYAEGRYRRMRVTPSVTWREQGSGIRHAIVRVRCMATILATDRYVMHAARSTMR